MKRPLLLPLVPLYAAAVALREVRLDRGWERVRRLRYPVISIGNLSTGGSGKTPLTIALARLLGSRGFQVDVLSRGYGRRSAVPLRVNREGTAERYGDEPLLIARATGLPVYVAPERYDAGRLAESVTEVERARRVHILDDGFQHRQLARDIDVLLVDSEDWRDHLLPAGNLREGRDAARRAGVIAIPIEDAGLEAEIRDWGWSGEVWRLRRRMEVSRVEGPVAAFCGIARPEQFFAGLRAAGLMLASHRVFPDHHRYEERDVEGIVRGARWANAKTVITTEKDLVRIDGLASGFPPDLPPKTVGLSSEIEDEAAVVAWIEQKIARQTQFPTSVG